MGALKMGLAEADLPEIVARWRASNKRIQDLWYTVENTALEVVEAGHALGCVKGIIFARKTDYDSGLDFLTVLLPSGRKLYYAKPVLSKGLHGRQAITYLGMNQDTRRWENIPTYGGKLVENITQAIARDCLAVALVRLDAEGYKICMNIHDEVIIDFPGPDPETELKKICGIMSQPIPWAPGLLLNADGFTGGYYKKE
jgi:DNA polymerase